MTTTDHQTKDTLEPQNSSEQKPTGTTADEEGAANATSGRGVIKTYKIDWHAKSKIGSLDNVTHKPRTPKAKIRNKRLSWKAESKIALYVSKKRPGDRGEGGEAEEEREGQKRHSVGNVEEQQKPKILSEKLSWNSKSKIDSLANIDHKPKESSVRIQNKKLDWTSVSSRVGSLDNLEHKPKGGDKKIRSRRLEWPVQARIGSLANVGYKSKGGNLRMVVVTPPKRSNGHGEEKQLHQNGDGAVVDGENQDTNWNDSTNIAYTKPATNRPRATVT